MTMQMVQRQCERDSNHERCVRHELVHKTDVSHPHVMPRSIRFEDHRRSTSSATLNSYVDGAVAYRRMLLDESRAMQAPRFSAPAVRLARQYPRAWDGVRVAPSPASRWLTVPGGFAENERIPCSDAFLEILPQPDRPVLDDTRGGPITSRPVCIWYMSMMPHFPVRQAVDEVLTVG